MNLLENYVTEVIGKPYYDDYGSGNYKWWIRVKSICYGHENESTLMFDTEEEALKVTKGYMYLS
jgi:hypothetical protein|nr:MAG TPA: hypothetical protein [Bacteriophage sp.]